MQDHQAKIAVSEEAAETSSSSVSSMPIMSEAQTVLAVFFAAEAPAVVVMGMSMQEGSPECV
jgi:hypothetical protein